MTSVIMQCCQALEQGVSCDFSDPFYIKDVYNPAYYNGPAISETILAALFIIICSIAVFNLVKIFQRGRSLDLKVTFLMNILVLAFSLLWFVYALDGPIQLFSGDFGFSPNTVAVFQIYAICVLHLALIFSSYTWLNLILLYRQKSKKLIIFVKLCFLLDLLYVCIILFMSIIWEPIDMDQGVTTSFITLSISALINGLVFSGSCFLLAGNLKEIYFFDREQQSKIYLLKIYAVIIGFLSIVRSVNDFLSFVAGDWQAKWKVESYCNQEPGWALYLFFYSFLTDMLPTLLLLTIFSPAIRQKAEESFMRSYSSHLEDMEDYEETHKQRSLLSYNDYSKF